MALDDKTLESVKKAVEDAIVCQKKGFDKIESRLSQIEDNLMELQYLNKADELCNKLKYAILSHTLLYPDIVEFELLLPRLNIRHFSYIMDRLRRIKMLTIPTLMFDKQIKDSATQDDILNACLSEYSGGDPMPIDDYDKIQLSPLLIKHFNEIKLDYSSYLNELLCVSKSIASTKEISIDDNFAITSWAFHTAYNRSKLEDVFDFLSDNKYIIGGAEEKATFISIFNISATVPEKKILIIKKGTKNKEFYVSWLYVLFKTLLGIDELSTIEKKRIASFFTLPDNAIEPNSIKVRKETEDTTQLKTKLNDILKS